MPVSETLESVSKILGKFGIEFPTEPHGRELPGPYLVRCERDLDQFLINPSFKPTSGKYWYYGVFWGDNARCLMNGIGLFVVKTEVINPEGKWLIDGTDEMEKEVVHAASKTNPPLSLKTIGGYFSAAKKVCEEYPIYHPREGIVTFPTEISLSETELVLINTRYLNDFPNKIPPILYNKLVPI